MVLTILAVIRISAEGGATSKIGEARFWERGLTRSPPKFLKFLKRFSRQNFQKKKKNGGRGPTGPLILVVHFGDTVIVLHDGEFQLKNAKGLYLLSNGLTCVCLLHQYYKCSIALYHVYSRFHLEGLNDLSRQ
jgi:hypothetical protein